MEIQQVMTMDPAVFSKINEVLREGGKVIHVVTTHGANGRSLAVVEADEEVFKKCCEGGVAY